MRRWRWLFVAALAGLVVPAATRAAAGDRDSSFNGDGIVRAQLSSKGSNANAVAVQADVDSLGRILAAGSVNGNPERTAVVRYLN